MSYHLYHTKAFLLGGVPLGEADRYLFFFTDSLGFVGALAAGSRSPHSKMRNHLLNGNILEASFVRGKNSWRLTSAEVIFCPGLGKRRLAMMVASFLRRFLHGEGEFGGLWGDVSCVLNFLQDEELSGKDLEALYLLAVARILFHLGYWDVDNGLREFIESPISLDLMSRAYEKRGKISKMAREAVDHSHL